MRPRTYRWSPDPRSAAAAPAIAAPSAPPPVEAVARLDLQRYAGQWHEIARLPSSFGCRGEGEATAAYRLNTDGTIAVRHTGRSAGGTMLGADGTARQARPLDEPARLQLRFAAGWLGWLPFGWIDHWVIALDDDYRWAMVGEPRRESLWILAREARMPRPLLDALKAKARRMGYDLAPLIVASGRSDPRPP